MLKGVFIGCCARRSCSANVSMFTFGRQLRTEQQKVAANVFRTKPLTLCRNNTIIERLIKWERVSLRKYLTFQLLKPRLRLVAPYGSLSGVFWGQGSLFLVLRGLISAGFIPVVLNNESKLSLVEKNDRHVFIRLILFVWETFRVLLRALRLFFTFAPLLCLYPITCLSFGIRQLWWWFLLWAVESSGPVFIKLGQWASTRRDLFSSEFCDQFSRLQRSVQPHSWRFTCKRLEDAFGHHWRKVLVSFDNDYRPIGSGCIAQVYRAYLRIDRLSDLTTSSTRNLNGNADFDYSGVTFMILEGLEDLGLWSFDRYDEQINDVRTKDQSGKTSTKVSNFVDSSCGNENLVPVAVKVMHPGIHEAFRRDLFIMSTFVSVFESIVPGLHWLSLSRCMDEFASVMKKQIDLSLEAKNLEVFASHFRNVSSVVFPAPIRPLVTEQVLIETYEEGEPMMNFTKNGRYSSELKAKLADIGIEAVFRMIFSDNFVHGDLHPGNILVQNVDKQDKRESKLRMTDLMDTVIVDVKKSVAINPLRLVFLDCGITATLGERDYDNMFCVFTAVVRGRGEEVADLFLKHTRNHECRDVDSFRRDMAKIVSEFHEGQKNLKAVNVSSVITDLFGTLIRHKVQLEGNFAMVILSMMIIEGLGHSLNPNLNILEKARPFLMERHKKEMNDLQSPF